MRPDTSISMSQPHLPFSCEIRECRLSYPRQRFTGLIGSEYFGAPDQVLCNLDQIDIGARIIRCEPAQARSAYHLDRH